MLEFELISKCSITSLVTQYFIDRHKFLLLVLNKKILSTVAEKHMYWIFLNILEIISVYFYSQ